MTERSEGIEDTALWSRPPTQEEFMTGHRSP
jgi:hypothetical protein